MFLRRLLLAHSRSFILGTIGLGLANPPPNLNHSPNFIADAVEKVIDSVVNISVEIETQKFFKKPLVSSGSGFFISPGYILTNAHVVSEMMDSSSVWITTSDGIKLEGFVYALDMLADIALVKIKSKSLENYLTSSFQTQSSKFPWPVVQLGMGSMRLGDFVIAIGSPFGLQNTVTFGIISSLQRDFNQITSSGGNQDARVRYIQTDCVVHSGSSGGPLVNIYGEVIGINTSRAEMEGITFAIRMDSTLMMIKQLLKDGRVQRPFLGFNMLGLSKAVWNQLSERSVIGTKSPPVPYIKSGVLLTNVLRNSPADKAGLESFDVITVNFSFKLSI
jgi:S1-C subfamily serine protease